MRSMFQNQLISATAAVLTKPVSVGELRDEMLCTNRLELMLRLAVCCHSYIYIVNNTHCTSLSIFSHAHTEMDRCEKAGEFKRASFLCEHKREHRDANSSSTLTFSYNFAIHIALVFIRKMPYIAIQPMQSPVIRNDACSCRVTPTLSHCLTWYSFRENTIEFTLLNIFYLTRLNMNIVIYSIQHYTDNEITWIQ